MRHNKKFNHLGRKSAHRKAMLSNMASSLILNKRIITTTAKAKALRIYVEPLITKAKPENNTTTENGSSNRRIVFAQATAELCLLNCKTSMPLLSCSVRLARKWLHVPVVIPELSVCQKTVKAMPLRWH